MRAYNDWSKDAACSNGTPRDVIIRFTVPTWQLIPCPDVQAICDRCPVRQDCLMFALEKDDRGEWEEVYGGLTAFQRRQLGSRRPRVKCPSCKAENIGVLDQCGICIACGLTWVL